MRDLQSEDMLARLGNIEAGSYLVVFLAVPLFVGWKLYNLEDEACDLKSDDEMKIIDGFLRFFDEFTSQHDIEAAWRFSCFYLGLSLFLNVYRIPNKMVILDVFSLAVMIHLFSIHFTMAIIFVAFCFTALALACGRRQLPFYLTVLSILSSLSAFMKTNLWPAFNKEIFAKRNYFTYFHWSMVRSIIAALDHAASTSRSLGQIAYDCVFYICAWGINMGAPFVEMTHWLRLRESQHEFSRSSPFEWASEAKEKGTSYRRVLTFGLCLKRVLLIGVACLVYTYGFERVDCTKLIWQSAVWVYRGSGASDLDLWIVFFSTYVGVTKYYVSCFILFWSARLIWDTQQFLLSPAFRKTAEGETPNDLDKEWRKASWWCRLKKTKVTLDCLIAPGPVFVTLANNSSSTWRSFDVGLYMFMKNYIYVPLSKALLSYFPIKDGETAQKPMIREGCQTLACLLSFLFIFGFHQRNFETFLWITTSFTLWFLDRYLAKLHTALELDKILSPVWDRRLHTFVYACSKLFTVTSFITHFGTVHSGTVVFKAIFSRFHVFVQILFYSYCSQNVYIEWQLRTVDYPPLDTKQLD